MCDTHGGNDLQIQLRYYYVRSGTEQPGKKDVGSLADISPRSALTGASASRTSEEEAGEIGVCNSCYSNVLVDAKLRVFTLGS